MLKFIPFVLVAGVLVSGAVAPRNSLAQERREPEKSSVVTTGQQPKARVGEEPKPAGLLDLGLDYGGSVVEAATGLTLLRPSAISVRAMPVLKKGDLLVTWSRLSPSRIFPGDWNHVAIFDGNGFVIESQFPGGVQKTSLAPFINSSDKINVYRPNAKLTTSLVDYANKQIGQSYINFNCVKLARVSYYAATLNVGAGDDPGWRWPEHVTKDSRLIFVGSK